MRFQSGTGYLIELVDGSGARRDYERCDTEAHAALRHATLTDGAARIQARLDARDGVTPPVRRAKRPREPVHHPRVSFALPPDLVASLLVEARRRQLSLSNLATRLLAAGLQRRR